MSVTIKTSRDRGQWSWRIVGYFGELVTKSRVHCRTQAIAVQTARDALKEFPSGLYQLRTAKKGGK